MSLMCVATGHDIYIHIMAAMARIGGNLCKHRLTLISAWISNHMLSKVFCEITYPFPNFNGFRVEVGE